MGEDAAAAGSIQADEITTTTRDRHELAAALVAWMEGVLPGGADPEVLEVDRPSGNGMSSETLLLRARWAEGADRVERQLVARLEPELDKLPVFPDYDLALQYRVMELVGGETSVPVPAVRWFEPDRAVLGAPFFVMDAVAGEVPRDVLPYTFPDPNWVLDATDAQRDHLESSAVDALVGIHGIGPDTHDLSFLLRPGIEGGSALERDLAWWEGYVDWVTGAERSPLLDRCFAWLREHLPSDTAPDALAWGDARIGNMLFSGFEVQAVLDWEMATIAPPEVDLGWMVYLHAFFQDLTTDLGEPGLPGFMRPERLVARYEERSGRSLGDLTWHIAYAAMRHGAIMRQVTERAIAFGQAVRPTDPDDMILHRSTLRAMLDGSYWDRFHR